MVWDIDAGQAASATLTTRDPPPPLVDRASDLLFIVEPRVALQQPVPRGELSTRTGNDRGELVVFHRRPDGAYPCLCCRSITRQFVTVPGDYFLTTAAAAISTTTFPLIFFRLVCRVAVHCPLR